MTLTAAPNPTPDLDTARKAFADFVTPIPRDARVVALHDSDADGVSAGVVWQRGLERLGFTHVQRCSPTGSVPPGPKATARRCKRPSRTACSF